jgi:tetratricopeptide (TPR) repeat protein
MQRPCFYRATVGALLLLATSAIPVRGQSAEDRLQQHFEAAQQAQQAGDLDGAAREYQAAIQINPEIAELYANLGLVYYAQSKFSDSAVALATAAKLKPGLAGVTLWMGINDVRLGEPAKAVPLLREAVHENPNDLQAERFYGTALWNAGESFPAIDQMTKTCAIFPADIDSSFALSEMYRKAANHQMESVLATSNGTPLLQLVYGDIYKEQHAWVRASAHYRQAIKQDPASKGAHLGLGEADVAQNKLTEAEAEFQQELKVDPDSVEATAWLAEIDLFSGKAQAAMPLLKQAIQHSPYRTLAAFQFDRSAAAAPSVTSNANTTQLRQADAELQPMPESAARTLALAIIDNEAALPALHSDLKRYQEFLPKASSAQSGFGEAERNAALGRFQPAAQQLRSWLDLHPNDVKSRYLFAKVLKQLSLAASERVVAIDPESPRVYQLLGQIYADRSEEDKALAEYKLVEQSNPSLPGIHYEIGHLEWQFGDRADALLEFHKELAIDPYHAEANGEIGSILLVENQPQAAISYLETALHIDPSLVVAHQQLGKAYVMLKDYKKAEPELEKAAATDLDGSVYYQLWILYRAQGRKDDAARAIEHCQQLRAQNTGEAQNLARETVAP